MSPGTIIRDAGIDGVALALTPAGKIRIHGDKAAVAKWVPAIRDQKPALLDLLPQANPPLTATEDQEAIEEVKAERAAIAEIDGGLTRAHARYLAELAAAYYAHHWSCPTCRQNTITGAGVHLPCAEGAELWRRYAGAAQRGPRA